MATIKGCLEAMPVKQTSLTYKEQKKKKEKNTMQCVYTQAHPGNARVVLTFFFSFSFKVVAVVEDKLFITNHSVVA